MKLRMLFFSLVLLAMGGSLFSPSAKSQSVVVGASCSASGQNAIANTGQPVVCTQNSGGSLVWTGVASGSSGSAPSSVYTFSVSNGTVTATPNGGLGLSTYSGTDAAVVINNALNATSSTGGQFYFKNGIYPINSLTAETNQGCATAFAAPLYYGIGIPNLPAGSWVQYLLIGETKPVLNIGYQFTGSKQANGVIFDVTPTAISSVAAGTFIVGIWQRPNNISTGCNSPLPSTILANDDYIKNLGVRFPTNQRGNEAAALLWFASSVEYDNIWAGFNMNETGAGSLQTSAPVPGTVGSFGLSTSLSNTAEQQHFQNTFAFGFDTCYDIQAEHTVGDTMVTEYCNFPAKIGRNAGNGSPINHPIVLTHFTDAENLNGLWIGGNTVSGSRIDLIGYDMELGSSNWYARSVAGFFETNCGYSSGLITYIAAAQNVGTVAEKPSSQLFTTCGQNFQALEGTASPNLAQLPSTDTFPGPNGGISAAWLQNGGCTLVSHAASASGGQSCIGYYAPQVQTPDQFSIATVGTVTSTSSVYVIVRAQSSVPFPNSSYYIYGCSTSGGSPTTRQISRTTTGTQVVLISTTANSGCGAGDTIELDIVGNVLRAFYTPSGGAKTLDLETTDSNFTNGLPGIAVVTSAASISNWRGGSFPTKTGADSIYSGSLLNGVPTKAFIFGADYTNATTTFSNVIGANGNPGTGLLFPVAANTSYTMHCAFVWSASAATAGPQFQITGPATPTSVSITMASAITATTTASAAATAFSSPLNPVGATVTSGANEWAQIDMGLVNGANAGTVQLQAAAQGAGTLTLRQGSSCTLQ